MAEKASKTITGLEPNVEAALCYVGFWISGIVFLLLEKKDKKLRFHAMQSLVVFGGASLLWLIVYRLILPMLFLGGAFIFSPLWGFISLIMTLVGLGLFILWLVLIVKTYQGEEFVVPVLGEFAKKQLK